MKSSKNYRGLTEAEVLKSREQYGVNILTPPEKESLWSKFLEKFEDPLIRILLVAGILSIGIFLVGNDSPTISPESVFTFLLFVFI